MSKEDLKRNDTIPFPWQEEWCIVGELGQGAFGSVYEIRRQDHGLEAVSAMKVISVPQSEKDIRELADTGMEREEIRAYYQEMVTALQREIQIMEEMKSAAGVVAIEDYAIWETGDFVLPSAAETRGRAESSESAGDSSESAAHTGAPVDSTAPVEHGAPGAESSESAGIGWKIFIRMEKLESINDYRERVGGLRLSEVLQIGIDMCQALTSCQAAGITHRDIKPENVFRSKYGNYKLGDFGIAHQIQTNTLLMHSHKGTTPYMAPEIIRGEDYDATVDIYALGIMLYRFLNHNRLPFMPPFPEIIHPNDFLKASTKRLSGAPMLPPDEADSQLGGFVQKACAFTPQARYQTPAAFRRDLEGYLFRMEAPAASEPGTKPAQDVAQDMYVAYDPYNMKQVYGRPDTGMAVANTVTMVGAPEIPAGPKVAATDLPPESPKDPSTPTGPSSPADPSTPTGPEPQGAPTALVPAAPGRRSRKGAHRKNQNSGNRKIKIAAGMLGALLIAIIIGGSIFVTQYTKVPSLNRKTVDEAQKVLHECGLKYNIDRYEFSDEVASGSIMSQSPRSNLFRRKGTVIHIVVSKGTNKVTVPSVVGMSQEEAVTTLQNAGLKVNIEETNNVFREAGVRKQSIAEGERVVRGSTVTITVNQRSWRSTWNRWFGDQ